MASAILAIFFLETLWLAPGVLFATCVVAPWARMCGWSPKRIWIISVLCVLGYFAAYSIVNTTGGFLAPVGTAIGTTIMLIPAFLDDVPAVRRAARRALIVGIVAAFVFTGFAFVPQEWWVALLWMIVWQVAVAAALAPAAQRASATKATVDIVKGGCPRQAW